MFLQAPTHGRTAVILQYAQIHVSHLPCVWRRTEVRCYNRNFHCCILRVCASARLPFTRRLHTNTDYIDWPTSDYVGWNRFWMKVYSTVLVVLVLGGEHRKPEHQNENGRIHFHPKTVPSKIITRGPTNIVRVCGSLRPATPSH